MSEYLTRYSINGSLVGSSSIPSFSFRGIPGNIPSPLVYICPLCGDAWAKRNVYGGGVYRSTTNNLCFACGPGFLFIQYEPVIYINHAPKEVLRRELNLIALLPDANDYAMRYQLLNKELAVHNFHRL